MPFVFINWYAQPGGTHTAFLVVMPPASKKLTGHVGFGLCVHASVHSWRTMHTRVLKFHIWIPHGKIADTCFFSCPSYLPFWSYALLKNAISCEPCMLGFWNFIYEFLMKKGLTCIFFLSELSPFLEFCPFEKHRLKSDTCHVLWTVHARVLKFHICIPHGKIADQYFISCPSYLPF